MRDIDVAPLPLSHLESHLDEVAVKRLQTSLAGAEALLEGRTVWTVTPSAAAGSGPAETVAPLVGYALGAGLDVRWLSLDAPEEFTQISGRLHAGIHGDRGDGGKLGDKQRDIYEHVLSSNAENIVDEVRSDDVVILHDPPTAGLAKALKAAGATVICTLSASNAVVGKADYRRELVVGQSARLVSAYVYASAGWGESTQDLVFSAHDLIAENGVLLAQASPFGEAAVTTEIDVASLSAERRRLSTFGCTPTAQDAGYEVTTFSLATADTRLTRRVDPHPFVPANPARRAERCEDVLSIQSHGLAKRLSHTRSDCAVVGVSGGLDSTLALLVCARAFDILGLDRSGILAVTMPGFGTTDRTHGNATVLADTLGATLREVDITTAVLQHFSDIGHDESDHSVTYENAQARERMQVLMDMANQEGGLVVGTGDLSELALGWATYNADHMSMYGVNAGIPKTLVRHLVRYVADTTASDGLSRVLLDVLDTPVSPELLPATAHGTISQRTEDLVGPYELHDFFLYQVLRRGFAPRKVYRLARYALGEGTAAGYDDATILKWLRTFYRRFFSQQFKRSCLPDGPKVGSVAVSPRGDLRMPSDACANSWLRELAGLGK